jgi:riboflavin synthase
MFTGLIEERGRVAAVERTAAGGTRLWIEAGVVLEDARVGDSIAVNGCCLTVAALAPGRWAADTVPETLARTAIGTWRPGRHVNLERALRLDQRLGGHLVQGHVDGVGEVVSMRPEGDGVRMRLAIPTELRRYVAMKGSLAVDGISLTVAALTADGCEIALVPHTLQVTAADAWTAGGPVHLEVDLLARYIARLLEAGAPTGGTS